MNHARLPARTTAVLAVCLLSVGAAACGSSATKTAAPSPTTTGAGSSPAPAASAEVKIVNFMFQPMTVTVKVGGTVTWLQVDTTGHSVESDTNAWTTSAVLSPGQTFSHTFTKAGTYSYICGVHTYMKGTVTVTG